jgi:phosphatidylglycerol:prolipoprotein diacylglycerol transferase
MIATLPFPDIDPVLISFEIFGVTLAIRWYALAYIAGFVLAWRWIVRLTRRKDLWPRDAAPMDAKQVEDMLGWVVIGVILGGRLGYVLFYNSGMFLHDPVGILRVWQGGMSFHGGFIGVILSVLLFCKIYKLPAWSVGDAVAFAAPFGLFLGRLANFINAELWGRPTDVPWAVVFPGEAAQTCPIWWLGEVCSRHPSQIYEALLEGVVLFIVMAVLAFGYKILKRPGMMIGVFFLGYGTARVIVENFRQGDMQYVSIANPMGHIIRFGAELDSAGLTMGQVLSIPMVLIGLTLIWFRRRAL